MYSYYFYLAPDKQSEEAENKEYSIIKQGGGERQKTIFFKNTSKHHERKKAMEMTQGKLTQEFKRRQTNK